MKSTSTLLIQSRKLWIMMGFFLFTFLHFLVNIVFKQWDTLEQIHLSCPLVKPTQRPYLANRKQLYKHVQTRYDLILLDSTPKGTRPYSDMELPGWRQTSNIMYVLGKYDIANSFVLINSTCNQLCITIFLSHASERDIIFNGAWNQTFVMSHFNVDGVYQLDELPMFIAGKTVYSTSPEIASLLPNHIKDKVTHHNAIIEYNEHVSEAFIESRFIKTRPELEFLSYAGRTASFSHKKIIDYIHSSTYVSESGLAAYFTFVSAICGCNLQAYNPIVGAGTHSAVLHFPTGETNDSGTMDIPFQDFILIDAAGAYEGYASDVTRTYARTSTPKLQQLSKIVYASQQAGIKAHKLGNKWSDVVHESIVALTKGLWEMGMLVAPDLNTLLLSGVISVFLPHGIGHPIGLDVHDPIPSKYKKTFQSTNIQYTYPVQLAYDYHLEKGHVHTVEPGIYFIPYQLEKARTNQSWGVADFINWNVVEEWKDVGGVRIEDVVAIDWQGNSIVLTI